MPGGGTPALAPINTPAWVCAAPPGSNACADDHDSANTPAAANRALPFNLMCVPRLILYEGDPSGLLRSPSTQRRVNLLPSRHTDKLEMFLKIDVRRTHTRC